MDDAASTEGAPARRVLMLLVIDDRGTFGINERIYPEEFSSFLEGEEFYVPVVGRSGIDANGRFAIVRAWCVAF